MPIRVGFSNLPAPGRPGAWGLGPGAASAAQGPTGPSSDNSVMCHVAVPAGSESDGSGSLTAEVAGKSAAVLAWGMLIDAVLIVQNFRGFNGPWPTQPWAGGPAPWPRGRPGAAGSAPPSPLGDGAPRASSVTLPSLREAAVTGLLVRLRRHRE